jgi:hypothetical protein
LLAERRARNIVLREGAAVIAALFAGKADAKPINRIQVGFARTGAQPELTALTPPDPPVDPQHLATELGPDAFEITADQPGRIQVSIRALFKPTADLTSVSEAGLLAGDRLYNQVVFEPVDLHVGQDVTFFWEVDFPFGH